MAVIVQVRQIGQATGPLTERVIAAAIGPVLATGRAAAIVVVRRTAPGAETARRRPTVAVPVQPSVAAEATAAAP